MNGIFTKSELESAKKAMLSWQHKITKVRETLSKKEKLPKAQLTLSARNLKAIEISLILIDKELDKIY